MPLKIDRTGAAAPFAVPLDQTKSSSLVDISDVLHRQARELQASTAENRKAHLVRDLEDRTQRLAVKDAKELLAFISESGLAWRDVARLAGVSVPAVQKWRRGEGMAGARRLKIAGIAAFLQALNDRLVNEPASWLEMPVKDGLTLTRLDLLAGERPDLVLLLISEDGNTVETDRILDEYDPEWRSHFRDDSFEVFLAPDGIASIRMR